MAGVYTQKRELSNGKINFSITYPNGNVIDFDESVPRSHQITKSYRSGKGAKGFVPDNDLNAVGQGRSLYDDDLNAAFERYSTPYDNGHEFSSKKYVYIGGGNTINVQSSEVPRAYKGPVIIEARNSEWIDPGPIDISYGTKAILATQPNASEANLANTGAELLRELPNGIGAALLGGRGSAPRAIGEEYLNFTFGVSPTVADLQKALRAVLNSERIISQYVRDSGRVVRRRKSFPVISYDKEFQYYNYVQPLRPGLTAGMGIYDNPYGTLTNSASFRERYWFSGAYVYNVIGGNNLVDKAARFAQLADKLLGTNITLDTVYQLTPWSWLVDWIVEIGPVIAANVNFASDNLVMKYGYLMRESTVNNTYNLTGLAFRGKGESSYSCTYQTIWKERVKATPYGFGLNTEGFSPQQWAILAALGLTKGDNKLR